MLFALLSLFSKSNYFKILLIALESLYLIHFTFIAYFGTHVRSSDVYLFFTHITETFETLGTLYEMVLYPLFVVGVTSFIVISMSYKKSTIPAFLLSLFLLFSFWLQEKLHDASLVLIKESVKALFLQKGQGVIQKSEEHKNIPLYRSDNNIILVLGESMRSREHLKERYKIFENYNYKTILSGATNTDIALPLLLNGALSPKTLDLQNNLFLLAKQNGYKTSFFTTQSQKSLQYILPYLSTGHIDTFKVEGSRDDKELLTHLKTLSLDEKNFIVLQMQGEHSPYIYYENASRSTSIEQRYHLSMLYSDTVLRQLIAYVSSNSSKPYIFIFVSDHGEMLGENGKTGHNRFEKEIYSVPLVMHSNLEMHLEKIASHNDIYTLINHYMGYTKEFKQNDRKTVRIYGTMMSEEDGYRDIQR
ncbi:MAG: sulfatase-like hydrolase/transferase [Sulfurimonas sp.]|uniref:sulfatase-like hydrolase/transferase n=1 Tax=Sulfurimonas sp. TaxID=2022749 RepID=UPI002638AE11|nr:sulfatase-like hydrolase/transferase [Sulfurimonas sp.]MDD2651965.1 sulfatase-like hydrolase/transferase [Sulfurimonas sp.]MDD3451909.1 sulfatase-like hydrolase/transferase [Sulfurimonas sp.]